MKVWRLCKIFEDQKNGGRSKHVAHSFFWRGEETYEPGQDVPTIELDTAQFKRELKKFFDGGAALGVYYVCVVDGYGLHNIVTVRFGEEEGKRKISFLRSFF